MFRLSSVLALSLIAAGCGHREADVAHTEAALGVRTNLAQSKSARAWPVSPGTAFSDAKLAVDGNTNGDSSSLTFTVTDPGAGPGYEVDLGSAGWIDSVELWSVWGRINPMPVPKGFYLLVSELPIVSQDVNQATHQAGVYVTYVKQQAQVPVQTINVGARGRYVRVQLENPPGAPFNKLALAELRVFGPSDGATPPPPAAGSGGSCTLPAAASSVCVGPWTFKSFKDA
jgi:hypothetical protein